MHDVEKDWTTEAGYRAVCIVGKREDGTRSYRCGYVGVTKDHPLHKIEYVGVSIDCHGGLTYSNRGGNYPVKSRGVWWFGFDCIHLGDSHIDVDIKYPMLSENGVVRSLEYVLNECERIASQLKEYETTARSTQ